METFLVRSVKLESVDKEKEIDGLSFEEYCDDVDRVRKEAIAAGVKGEAYKHYRTKKGLYTGVIVIKHKPLNNGDLYEFAKSKYERKVI
jgi:hypothetical protein